MKDIDLSLYHYIYIFYSDNNAVRQVPLIFPFYQIRNWSTGRVSALPKSHRSCTMEQTKQSSLVLITFPVILHTGYALESPGDIFKSIYAWALPSEQLKPNTISGEGTLPSVVRISPRWSLCAVRLSNQVGPASSIRDGLAAREAPGKLAEPWEEHHQGPGEKQDGSDPISLQSGCSVWFTCRHGLRLCSVKSDRH